MRPSAYRNPSPPSSLIGIDWSYRQQTFYAANNHSKSGHQWSRDLILFFWDEAYALWQLRNKAIHEPAVEIQRQDYVQRVEALYAQEPHVMAQDRNIFHAPLLSFSPKASTISTSNPTVLL